MKTTFLKPKTDPKPTDLLTRVEAAEYLGISAKTLAVWACVKRYNLPYVKVGCLVKYRRADLYPFNLKKLG
jgi:hypothetical protein